MAHTRTVAPVPSASSAIASAISARAWSRMMHTRSWPPMLRQARTALRAPAANSARISPQGYLCGLAGCVAVKVRNWDVLGRGAVLHRGDVHGGSHGGGGPVADRGGDLLGQLRPHVADRPDSIDRRLHVPIGDDVAPLVMVDVDLEQLRVGHKTDEDEDSADLQLLGLAVLLVTNDLHLVGADDLFHVGVEDELDLRVCLRPVDQDRLRP